MAKWPDDFMGKVLGFEPSTAMLAVAREDLRANGLGDDMAGREHLRSLLRAYVAGRAAGPKSPRNAVPRRVSRAFLARLQTEVTVDALKRSAGSDALGSRVAWRAAIRLAARREVRGRAARGPRFKALDQLDYAHARRMRGENWPDIHEAWKRSRPRAWQSGGWKQFERDVVRTARALGLVPETARPARKHAADAADASPLVRLGLGLVPLPQQSRTRPKRAARAS